MKYSNCLIEAIKAKIRNPKNVKVHFIRPCLNNGHIHFYWIEDDGVYQYGHKQPIKNPILFEGKVRLHCRATLEERLYKKMKAL